MTERIGIVPSGTTTSTAQVFNSPVYRNDEGGEALYLAVNVTAGTPAMLVSINAYDSTSRNGIALLTSSAISAGMNLLKLGPQLTAGANVAKEYLPYEFNVTVSGGAAGTYSIGAWIV